MRTPKLIEARAPSLMRLRSERSPMPASTAACLTGSNSGEFIDFHNRGTLGMFHAKPKFEGLRYPMVSQKQRFCVEHFAQPVDLPPDHGIPTFVKHFSFHGMFHAAHHDGRSWAFQ
jgi:hypothetical protein